jgi:hypothetical protein
VFIDTADGSFDSNPTLTFGCGDPNVCQALVPFAYDSTDAAVLSAAANNWAAGALSDNVGVGIELNPVADTADSDYQVYAVFVLAAGGVPEPATWVMMLLGFGLIGTSMRRRRAIGIAA